MEKVVTNSVDFTEGKVTIKIIKFVIPIIITGLLQMLYNASDMIVVGNFSPNGSFAMGGVSGMGKSLLSMLLTIVFAIIFRIVWLFTICIIFPNNITILYLSYPISWIMTTVIMVVCIFLYYKKLTLKKKIFPCEKVAKKS